MGLLAGLVRWQRRRTRGQALRHGSRYSESPSETGKALRRSSGQALVEFALLLPMLMLLVLGAVDFGRAMYAVITVNNASFHSALWAAQKLRQGEAGCGAGSTSTTYCCPTANNTTAVDTALPLRIRDVVIRDFLVGLSYTDTCPSATSSASSSCNPAVSCSTSVDADSHRYVDVTVTYRWTAIGPYDALVGQIDIPRTIRIRKLP